jgi:hypothetical protein
MHVIKSCVTCVSVSIPLHFSYPFLVSFHPGYCNLFLESLGLTVCENIVNNVVTAHLAQPHFKLPGVVLCAAE